LTGERAIPARPAAPARELHRRQAVTALALAAAATLALQWLPWLSWLGWPLLLVSTFAHELGHGLAAMAAGGRFTALVLWQDGSGVAAYSGRFSALALAWIAAVGLLGPPLAALLLLLAGRRSASAHRALAVAAAVLLASAVLWAGSLFTVAFCLLLALLLGLLAWRASQAVSQVVCVFLAMQLALASFARSDYLFTPVARTAQGPMPSDVAQIADALWLPYWLWGGLIAALSLCLLLFGAWRFVVALR
jgi:hypothetical protein